MYLIAKKDFYTTPLVLLSISNTQNPLETFLTKNKDLVYFSYLQFSDLLIYANRTTSPTLHFRVHGQMMLKDVTVLDSEPRLGQEHCFNLYDGKKAVLIAASSHAEKLCWMEDIAEAAQVGSTIK